MTSNDERARILRMIQEGKISPEEGLQLLDLLEMQTKRPRYPQPDSRPSHPFGGEGKWCRIHVSDTDSGKTKVNIRLPLGLVNAGIKMGARFSPELDGMDLSEFIQAAKKGETGQMIDVYDDDDREHVEIFIE